MHGNGEGELLRRLESFFPPQKSGLSWWQKDGSPERSTSPAAASPSSAVAPSASA